MFHRLIAAASVLAFASAAFAQSPAPYPNAPVKVVVPYIGGPPDTHARVFGEFFRTMTGQSLVIDNRGGAGGMIAAQYASRVPADGYTLLWAASSLFGVNPFVYRKLPYALEQFEPIANVAEVCFSLSVRPSLNVKTLPELLAMMKASPGKLNFANTGVGNQLHLTWELLQRVTGTQATSVQYKSGPDAVNAVLGGFADVLVYVVSGTDTQMYQKGMLVPLATTCRARVPQAPNVPTMAELGYPDFVVYGSYQLFAPKGVPREVLARLSEVAEAIKRDPEYQKRLNDMVASPARERTPAEFAAWLERDRRLWSDIAKAANVVVEN